MRCKKMKMKKFIILLIITCALFGLHANASVEDRILTVKINGQAINMDVHPYLKDESAMVPIWIISDVLGKTVEWDGSEYKITLSDENRNIEMWIDSEKVLVNGEEQKLTAPVELVNGRTMVPVRFIAENLDCTVDWDPLTYTVLINKEGAQLPASYVYNRSYTDDDILWLARIIQVEARGLSMDAKIAVANVVINRKYHTGFPNNIHDVIFDDTYSIQFPPAHKAGFKESTPNSDCIIAAKVALEGVNNVDACLFFNHRPFYDKDESELYRVIDGEYFYY